VLWKESSSVELARGVGGSAKANGYHELRAWLCAAAGRSVARAVSERGGGLKGVEVSE
jgi:hypothetical protein